MKIFVIGQLTLHWGRLEFGNIGNRYIIEPFFRELHRVFPTATIHTTFQMSQGFCRKENIACVPMDYYYSWRDNELQLAEEELAIAKEYAETHELKMVTPFIGECLSSDLVVDFSGDIWGRNADFLGKDRFLVGLIKDRVAQLLGCPTAMLAGSPGPFNNDAALPFAHEVFSRFDFVANREGISRRVLEDAGFELCKVMDSTCPAFMFEPACVEAVDNAIAGTALVSPDKPIVGFVLCGWNMLQGPFNRTDWRDEEFSPYVALLQHVVEKYSARICLMSHSNGFELPPRFKLIRGRDYPIVEQLYRILQTTPVARSVFLLDGVYNPETTKGIIGRFDMLISGRVHGAIAGLSQNVPTMIIDYGHEPKAHKLRGFAKVAGVDKYVGNPGDTGDLIAKADQLWVEKDNVRSMLQLRNIDIVALCRKQFDALKLIVSN